MKKDYGAFGADTSQKQEQDSSPEELNQIAGVDKTCDFVKADFMKMPFSDNKFDEVYAIEATCHAPDAEIYRVLKPGQSFATYEWCMTEAYDPQNKEHQHIKGVSTVRVFYELLSQSSLSVLHPDAQKPTVEALSSVSGPESALRLYLQCAEAANDSDLEPVAYEFFTQAYIMYEKEISDSKAQIMALHLIIGMLQRMHVFGVENRDTLTHKATGYSAKLLKKPDQCRAVYACSQLFWVDDQDDVKDGERDVICRKAAS
ncbi:hypothetical protein ACFE04_022187 [Oxalis oulophora]